MCDILENKALRDVNEWMEDRVCFWKASGPTLHQHGISLWSIVLWTVVNGSQSSFTFYDLHYTTRQLHLSFCPFPVTWPISHSGLSEKLMSQRSN